MTDEQAKEVLMCNTNVGYGIVIENESTQVVEKALQRAFKALERQPSEDCVSRQAVLDKAELVELEDGQTFYCISPEDVKALPPVTPTRKVGRWVKKSQYGNDYCSECDYEHCGYGYPKYCPNCGTEMEEK